MSEIDVARLLYVCAVLVLFTLQTKQIPMQQRFPDTVYPQNLNIFW